MNRQAVDAPRTKVNPREEWITRQVTQRDEEQAQLKFELLIYKATLGIIALSALTAILGIK